MTNPSRPKSQSQRADLALVSRGFFASRAKAQEAITLGLVRIDGKTLSKASALIDEAMQIEAEAPYPWVSRGGVKLAAALDIFGFDPHGRVCLDVGASAGGFTDVLLSRGAARIHAVDVGRGQLHPKLRADPRVDCKEATDARTLTQSAFQTLPGLVTCDVSFISLKLVLPKSLALAAPDSMMIALIKPQFEVGPALVVKGMVKDEASRLRVCAEIEALVRDIGWTVTGLIPSPIEGSDGNCEYLIGARKSSR